MPLVVPAVLAGVAAWFVAGGALVVAAPVLAGAAVPDAAGGEPELAVAADVPDVPEAVEVVEVLDVLAGCVPDADAAEAAWAASWPANVVGSGAWMFATAPPGLPPGPVFRNAIVVGAGMTIPIPAASRSIR